MQQIAYLRGSSYHPLGATPRERGVDDLRYMRSELARDSPLPEVQHRILPYSHNSTPVHGREVTVEPFVELAIERWAREVNDKYDKELRDRKFQRLPLTHPHLFRGNPLKPTNKQVSERIRAIEEGNTEDVLKMKAAKKVKDNN